MKKLSVVTMSAIFVAVFAASPFAEDDGKHKVTEAQLRAAVSALQDQQQRTLDFLQEQIDRLVPVGAIMPWHKNLAATPDLPKGWVECNGQILDDPESPYNGQAIPNLNGEGRFLRGSNTSGVEEANTLAAHDHDVSLNASTVGGHSHDAATNIAAVGPHGHSANTSIAVAGQHDHGANTSIVANGQHSHVLDGVRMTADPDKANYYDIDTYAYGDQDMDSYTEYAGQHDHGASTSISVAGQHNHNANTSISVNGNHVHVANTSIAEFGSHSHVVNGKTASEGDGETRPVNMSVVYIMKVKLTYVQ